MKLPKYQGWLEFEEIIQSLIHVRAQRAYANIEVLPSSSFVTHCSEGLKVFMDRTITFKLEIPFLTKYYRFELKISAFGLDV